MYCHRGTQKREGFGSTLCLLFGSQEKTYDESAAILTCAQNVVSNIIIVRVMSLKYYKQHNGQWESLMYTTHCTINGLEGARHVASWCSLLLPFSHPLTIQIPVRHFEWSIPTNICWLNNLGASRWYINYYGVALL